MQCNVISTPSLTLSPETNPTRQSSTDNHHPPSSSFIIDITGTKSGGYAQRLEARPLARTYSLHPNIHRTNHLTVLIIISKSSLSQRGFALYSSVAWAAVDRVGKHCYHSDAARNWNHILVTKSDGTKPCHGTGIIARGMGEQTSKRATSERTLRFNIRSQKFGGGEQADNKWGTIDIIVCWTDEKLKRVIRLLSAQSLDNECKPAARAIDNAKASSYHDVVQKTKGTGRRGRQRGTEEHEDHR